MVTQPYRRVFNRLWTKAYYMSDSKINRIKERMGKVRRCKLDPDLKAPWFQNFNPQ